MEYRGIEYTVVQGIGRGVWKWSASVEGMIVTGNEQTRPAAGEGYRSCARGTDRSATTAPINGRHKAMTHGEKQQTSDVLRILTAREPCRPPRRPKR
jgi:hypothetical protein